MKILHFGSKMKRKIQKKKLKKIEAKFAEGE